MTWSRAQRATQDLEGEELKVLQAEEVQIQIPTTLTLLSEEADHEANSEAHQAFRIKLESRPDW